MHNICNAIHHLGLAVGQARADRREFTTLAVVTLRALSRSFRVCAAEMQMRARAVCSGVAGKPTTTRATPLSQHSRDSAAIFPGLKIMSGCTAKHTLIPCLHGLYLHGRNAGPSGTPPPRTHAATAAALAPVEKCSKACRTQEQLRPNSLSPCQRGMHRGAGNGGSP